MHAGDFHFYTGCRRPWERHSYTKDTTSQIILQTIGRMSHQGTGRAALRQGTAAFGAERGGRTAPPPRGTGRRPRAAGTWTRKTRLKFKKSIEAGWCDHCKTRGGSLNEGSLHPLARSLPRAPAGCWRERRGTGQETRASPGVTRGPETSPACCPDPSTRRGLNRRGAAGANPVLLREG